MGGIPIGDVGPELALALGAVAALLVALFVRHDRQWIAGVVASVGAVVSVGLAVRLHLQSPPGTTFSGTWALDALTLWGRSSVAVATMLVIALSPRWFRTDPRHGEWYALLLLSALGASLLVGAADLMELMVGMLLVSVTGYTLASYHRGSKRCAEAGAKYFLLGALSNPLLLLGIVLMYGLCGTTRYAGIGVALQLQSDPVALTAAVALLVAGIVFELGAFPLHPWVPDVSQASPAPAAGFLTVVPKIGAVVALFRLVSILPEGAVAWRPLVAAIAVATMTLGNLAALWQTDVRRLLGWSSVSQAGYGLMAVVALDRSDLAPAALVVFVLAYAAANLAAFGTVVALRGRTDLKDYRGLARVMPWHAVALTLAMLSLTGIPPLLGFGAKLLLFTGTIEAGYGWLAVVAVINTVISIFYYLRVIGAMVLGSPPRNVLTLGWSSSTVAIVAALLTVVGGLALPVIVEPTRGARIVPQIELEPVPAKEAEPTLAGSSLKGHGVARVTCDPMDLDPCSGASAATWTRPGPGPWPRPCCRPGFPWSAVRPSAGRHRERPCASRPSRRPSSWPRRCRRCRPWRSCRSFPSASPGPRLRPCLRRQPA